MAKIYYTQTRNKAPFLNGRYAALEASIGIKLVGSRSRSRSDVGQVQVIFEYICMR